MPTVADFTAYLDTLYPQETAEPWDAVGLTVGQPDAEVLRVLAAVDIDPIVVAEAIDRRADLIVTHHPLYLSGTTTVAAIEPKGKMVHDLITNGIALYTAHTNADIAPHGVNEALATLLGLTDQRPLAPSTHALAHPGSGLGRIGRLSEPVTLQEFGARVATALPPTEHGVRISGSLERMVATVAVCGGAGDSLLRAAHGAGVDVYLTADLRHHRAQEAAYLPGAPALVDVAHFASEWPWVPEITRLLGEKFEIDVHASTLNTDPWTDKLESITTGGSQ